jgi:hypothetical protein
MTTRWPTLLRQMQLDKCIATDGTIAGSGSDVRLSDRAERAYGQNNSILDNCHVRVSFAANDERTAKRVSDALGTATEMRESANYAGHRL